MSLTKQHRQAVEPIEDIDMISLPPGYDPVLDKGPYMNSIMLKYFKNELQRKAEEIGKDLKRFSEAFSQTADFSDILDRSNIVAEQAQASAQIDKQRKLRNKINALVADIKDNGTGSEYGYSELSGVEIGVGRLMAKPWATKTTDEQEHEDRRLKGTPRPNRDLY